jgi:hypothetical protein
MAMTFETARQKLGQSASTALIEGGAVIGGLFIGGMAGKRVEKVFKSGVTTSSPMQDKILAYVANNATKGLIWYGIKKYVEDPTADARTDMPTAMLVDGRKGLMASIALDTFGRITNQFAPKPFRVWNIDIMGEDASRSNGNVQQLQSNVQRMVQENSSLRSQLNQAMSKLASAPTVNVRELAPPQSHDTRFGMMQSTPEAENRRKNYGAMAPPLIEERERRFGAMNKAGLQFAGETDSVASMYGML